MILLVLVLILLSATFSGLTIGMFSLGLSGLERKIKLGNKKAQKIYEIRKNGNFLLCTLLLGNVAINSAISVAMSEVASGVIAGIISTALIFVFGEVIPQAVFSKYAFEVGSRTTWLVRIFMVIMWPIAKPLSIILDYMFGKEFPELFDKHELAALLDDSLTIDTGENFIVVVNDDRYDKKWEHVSVSISHRTFEKSRCPTWEEMCHIKSLFWEDEETIVQFHPKKSEYKNAHPYCLHMWRDTTKEHELPPSIYVAL